MFMKNHNLKFPFMFFGKWDFIITQTKLKWMNGTAERLEERKNERKKESKIKECEN